MSKNIESIIDSYGYDKARALILEECLTYVQLHKELGISTSDTRINANIYKRIFNYLNIKEIPYKEDTQPLRKLKVQFDLYNGEYWKSEYIIDFLLEKLKHPIVNIAEGTKRYVISFPKHPKADSTSNQIKAHIIVWELFNEMYVPEGSWVIPIDGDYTNIDITNLKLVNTVEYKSQRFSDINNPAYKHGLNKRPKTGGWSKISNNLRYGNMCCSCKSTENLVVHHIISYHLFNNPIDAHQLDNLLVLCNSCHATIHQNNINIKALIEETQYSKLLKLLETLKSQVPDTLMETYKDVEKQLGLTDNQQPST